MTEAEEREAEAEAWFVQARAELEAEELASKRDHDHRLALAYERHRDALLVERPAATWADYNAPGEPYGDFEALVWSRAEQDVTREDAMELWQKQEARGMHLPWRDGVTEADLAGIDLVATQTSDGVRRFHRYPDGQQFPANEGAALLLEQDVALHVPIVASQHATGGHADAVAEFCAHCLARRGGGQEPTKSERVTASARIRRQLKLRRKLPEVHVPQPVAELLDAAELLATDPPSYLIDGLVPHNAVGYLLATWGKGKTFLALDLALNVAANLDDWHGRERENATYTGRAVYVYSEAPNAAGGRVAAWLDHHGLTADDLGDRFLLYPGAVNLFTGGASYDRLLATAGQLRPELVVLDTLQTCTVGADHNSASDMAVVGERLRALQRASGGVVLVLAHAGKNGQGARGSSAIEGDADFVLAIEEWSAPGAVKVAVPKQKDGPSGWSFTLGVRSHAGSLVLASEPPEVAFSSTTPTSRVLGALRQLAPTGPATVPQVQAVIDDDGLPAMNRGSTHKVLGRLVSSGEVRQLIKGATKRYALPEADQ